MHARVHVHMLMYTCNIYITDSVICMDIHVIRQLIITQEHECIMNHYVCHAYIFMGITYIYIYWKKNLMQNICICVIGEFSNYTWHLLNSTENCNSS